MYNTKRSSNPISLTAEAAGMEIDPLTLGLISIQSKQAVAYMGEITVPDTYDGNSLEFHTSGLYSSTVFGLKGSDERMSKFGYISLNTDILVPDVYIQLKKARSLYEEIMKGKAYVLFNPVTKEFDPTPLEDGGQTGYSYFMKYLPVLQPEDTGASTRRRLIRLLAKYKGNLTTKYFLVIPAGYRDIEQTEDGRMESDDINPLYLALLRAVSFIQSADTNYDTFRFQAQLAVNAIADYIATILNGKSGLINAKFAKRGVRQGSRNVITSQIHDVSDVDSPSNLNLLDSTVGMPQLLAMYPDKILYHVKQLLSPMMPEVGYPFTVIDPYTHKTKEVKFDPDLYNLFMTATGFTSLLKIIKVKDNRIKPIKYEEYWIGALYKPPGEVHVVDSPLLLDDYNPAYLHPITIVELLYIAIMQIEGSLVGTNTRPPVLGQGGISQHICRAYFTDPFEVREDSNGMVGGRYPILSYAYDSKLKPYGKQQVSLEGTFNDSFSISELTLKAKAGDYDGDALSSLPITTDEAIDEIQESLTKASTYFTPNRKLIYSLGSVDVANAILLTLTSG